MDRYLQSFLHSSSYHEVEQVPSQPLRDEKLLFRLLSILKINLFVLNDLGSS